MSELSMDELQAETGELLPERETLAVVNIQNIGFANADQFLTNRSSNSATTVQTIVLRGSFNHARF